MPAAVVIRDILDVILLGHCVDYGQILRDCDQAAQDHPRHTSLRDALWAKHAPDGKRRSS